MKDLVSLESESGTCRIVSVKKKTESVLLTHWPLEPHRNTKPHFMVESFQHPTSHFGEFSLIRSLIRDVESFRGSRGVFRVIRTVEWGPPDWGSSVLLCHFIWVRVCRQGSIFIQSFKERKILTINTALLFWCALVAHTVAHYPGSWGWESWFPLAKKKSHAGRNCSSVMIRESNKIQPQTFQKKKIKPLK